jgi:hypothetical protein
MVRYDTEIRKPEDILYRSSRPQRNSSYIPHARDWRYATGVFRHEDIVDARNESTVWDNLDHDFNVRKAGRMQLIREGDENEGGVYSEGVWYHRNGEEKNEQGVMKTPSPRRKMKRPNEGLKEKRHKKGSRATRVDLFEATEDTNKVTDEREYKQAGLIVRLKLFSETSVQTPKRLANRSFITPKSNNRQPTPVIGFRASGAPPTPPSTVKSVLIGRRRKPTPVEPSTLYDCPDTSYIKVNTVKEIVTANVVFPIRDVFTFPLLAIISMAGEGLQMGLEKASCRKKRREEEESRTAEQMKIHIPEVASQPYSVEESSRVIRDPASPLTKEEEMGKQHRIPQVLREKRGAITCPYRQNDLRKRGHITNESTAPQDRAALPPKEAMVQGRPQPTKVMTLLSNQTAEVTKGGLPRRMVRFSGQDTNGTASRPALPCLSETKNIRNDFPVPNAPLQLPTVVEDIAETLLKPEEVTEAEKPWRNPETVRQSRETAVKPGKKPDDAEKGEHPAAAEEIQAALGKRLNVLLEQEEHGDLPVLNIVPEHAEQVRTEHEKSEVGLQERNNKHCDVATVERVSPSTEKAKAELEQRKKLLLERMEKLAELSKSDGVLGTVDQASKTIGEMVEDYDAPMTDRKATAAEEVEPEMEELLKKNGTAVGSGISSLPPRPPTTETPPLFQRSPPPDYDTHGNPIPRTPKRAIDDVHDVGISKKSKTVPFALSSGDVSKRVWHRYCAPHGTRTANYHAKDSHQYQGSQTHHFSGYLAEAAQPYQQTRPPSTTRPYSYAQYPAFSTLSGNQGYSGASQGFSGGHSYPEAHYTSTSFLSSSHGLYNAQQYTSVTAGGTPHYEGALTYGVSPTFRGAYGQEIHRSRRREERGWIDIFGRR